MTASERREVARSPSIDAARFLAVAGVPFIHVEHVVPLNTWIDLVFRFAVPFFFVVAGYFLSRKPLKEAVTKQVIRLGVPFAVWVAVYFIAARSPLVNLATVDGWARLLLTGGAGYHLWFLSSLGVCSVILLTLRGRSWTLLFALSGAIYLFALLLEAYCKPLFGFENNVWRMRNGPFFGLLFMVVGHYLAVRRPAYPLWFGAALFIGGGLLQATEALTLLADDKTVSLDVLFGTVPFGVGAFMLALKIPEGSVTRCLAFLGRYALGIYAAHVLGLWIIQPFLLPGAFWATMLAALFALVFAVLVSVLLGRFKATRLLVA